MKTVSDKLISKQIHEKYIGHGKNMDGKYRWQVWMASILTKERIWMASTGSKYGWASMDGKYIGHDKNLDGKYRWQMWMGKHRWKVY